MSGFFGSIGSALGITGTTTLGIVAPTVTSGSAVPVRTRVANSSIGHNSSNSRNSSRLNSHNSSNSRNSSRLSSTPSMLSAPSSSRGLSSMSGGYRRKSKSKKSKSKKSKSKKTRRNCK